MAAVLIVSILAFGTPAGGTSKSAGPSTTSSASSPVPPVTLTVSYNVSGTPPQNAPIFHYVQNSQSQEVRLSSHPTPYQVDYGSSWSVDPIPSNSSDEQWAVAPSIATGIATNMSISFTYYHEFELSTSYVVEFGRAVTFQPILVVFQGGEQVSFPLANESFAWADAGSNWAVNQTFLGSSRLERWWADNATGIVTSAGALQVTYLHQYLLRMLVTPQDSGSTVPSNALGVEDWENAGSVVSIQANPASGYAFSSWSCSVPGLQNHSQVTICYAGLQNPSQVTMNGPINETSKFMSVVTVTVQVNGSTVPQFASINGTIVQVPYEFSWVPNSTHTILALSNVSCGVTFLFFNTCVYQFKGWTVNGFASAGNPLTVTADKPKTITSIYEEDYYPELILAVVVVTEFMLAAAVVVLLMFWRRRGQLPSQPGLPGPSGLSCRVGFLSDLGKSRSNNEDSILSLELLTLFESKPNATILSAVGDGVGGSHKGEVASRLTLETLATHAQSLLMYSKDADRVGLLKASIEAANDEVVQYGMAHRESEGLASTLVASVIEGNTGYIANVGDSRAYLVNRGGIKQLTKDHSHVQELVDSGQISLEQSRHDVRRNFITRAVGASTNVQVDIYTVSLAPGDRILLCTDGLWEPIADAEIHKLVMESTDPQTACGKLVALANDRGGRDNISLIIMELQGPKGTSNA